ncbi:sensor histidine kinase [Roseovarius mucosus]|uniref:sensor histidine kinase n=1 Tax=Roseovarius mucosus TaxID=215743 RepID=UPI003F6E5EDB
MAGRGDTYLCMVQGIAQAAQMRRHSGFLVWLVLGLIVLWGGGALVHAQATRVFLNEAAGRAEGTLQLATTALDGYLERFERLPPLLARQQPILDLAEAPDDPARVDAANRFLRDVTGVLGASDIYFMDTTGLTRAASNFDLPRSFVGGNFAFRPYFSDAVASGAGSFYALGTTSRKRGYYFGAPVRNGDTLLGVVALKIDVESVEAAWSGADYHVIVTDPKGVVFLSSNPAWRFGMTRPLTSEGQDLLETTRRYADSPLFDIPLRAQTTAQGHVLWEISLSTLPGAQGQGEYLLASAAMPEADWTLTVMQNTAPARAQALTFTAGAVLALALIGMMVAVVRQRRARLRDLLVMQAAAKVQLEARVAERTRELADVNEALGAEVAERRLVEVNLRRAQDDLVQAAKLAALGQMSAALGHEVNQPLGALRNYAENAVALLTRDRKAETQTALERILDMADRISAIARRLHTFGRRPGQQLGAVDVTEAIEAAQEIAGPRLRQVGATLSVDIAPGLSLVRAGPVRLQQVLVNLLTNAADAVADRAERRILLTARDEAEAVVLRVEDSGTGVPPDIALRIFDPFFSTKGVGNGLGLGLSITYNIIKDFDGAIALVPGTLGGAAFEVRLMSAPKQDLAAE